MFTCVMWTSFEVIGSKVKVAGLHDAGRENVPYLQKSRTRPPSRSRKPLRKPRLAG